MAIKIKKRYQGRVREENTDVINTMIKAPMLRVIVDSTKENLGVIPLAEALKQAEQHQLDLVLISAEANPPVAKIIDYGKFRYEKKKQQKEIQKNQKVIELKQIGLSANIGKHDLDIKIRKAEEFLKRGDKVKVSLRLRGRELEFKNIALEKIEYFKNAVKDFSTLEKEDVQQKNIEVIFAASSKK